MMAFIGSRIVKKLNGIATVRLCSTFSYENQHKNPSGGRPTKVPWAQYGGRHMVTMIPGVGVGPELMQYLRDVFRAAGTPILFEEVIIDPNSESDEDFNYAITSVKRNGVAIKGNIETKSELPGVISRNATLRNLLDLFVNIAHFRSIPVSTAKQNDIDIVMVRQNTEGEYTMLEHESVKGVVESMRVVTRENSERVARYAFEFARKNERKIVTIVHKADEVKLSDGLFLDVSRQIAQEYPEIKCNDMLIDPCCAQIVCSPQIFDVILTTNLYGAVLSNIICGLLGGSGITSGRNYGEFYAVFESATRYTGTEIAGQNIANPLCMLNAGVDLLEYLGHLKHVDVIRRAIDKTIMVDKIHPRELGGEYQSSEVVERIVDNIINFSQRIW